MAATFLFRQGVGKLGQITNGLGFVADCGVGSVVILPNGDDEKGQQIRRRPPITENLKPATSLLSFRRSGPNLLRQARKHQADAEDFEHRHYAKNQQPEGNDVDNTLQKHWERLLTCSSR